jgi:threonine dehydratase
LLNTENVKDDSSRRLCTPHPLACVYDVAKETPLEEARFLSRRLKNKVLLKREDLQPVFSFKIRGAYNKIAQLTAEEKAKGVICASAGNHAQGVGVSAQNLALKALLSCL